ncbi:MAG: hypothetical protein IPN01_26485 [Deltaproteobacteria bacterium]|nr:hypothetical protein [Deltaproteobacteria bacterium]
MSLSLKRHLQSSWMMWLYGLLMGVSFLMPQSYIFVARGYIDDASFEESSRFCIDTLVVWAQVAIVLSGAWYFFWCSFWFVVVRRFTRQGRPGAAWLDKLFKALILLIITSWGTLLWHAKQQQAQMNQDCESSSTAR